MPTTTVQTTCDQEVTHKFSVGDVIVLSSEATSPDRRKFEVTGISVNKYSKEVVYDLVQCVPERYTTWQDIKWADTNMQLDRPDPKFKVGDRLVLEEAPSDWGPWVVKEITGTRYMWEKEEVGTPIEWVEEYMVLAPEPETPKVTIDLTKPIFKIGDCGYQKVTCPHYWYQAAQKLLTLRGRGTVSDLDGRPIYSTFGTTQHGDFQWFVATATDGLMVLGLWKNRPR